VEGVMSELEEEEVGDSRTADKEKENEKDAVVPVIQVAEYAIANHFDK
jgi:hypothetical protein